MLDVYFAESVIEAVGQGSSFMGANNFAQYAQKQAFKQLYQSWKTKRVALDKTRTVSDIEHERRLKSKPRAGSVGEMTFHLKKKFGIWAKKGEFEKTIEYENRLNSTGIYYFDSLCIAISDEIWFWVKSQYFTADSKYDADNEVYTIELTYGDSVIGKKKIIGECKMPVEVAKKFSAKRLFITDAQVVGGLIVPKRLSVWQYYNGYHRYDFVFPEIPNATPFRICIKDIGLNYTGNIDTLLNHCFSYSDYYRHKTELARSLYNVYQITRAKFNDLEKEYADAALKYNFYYKFDEWFYGLYHEFGEYEFKAYDYKWNTYEYSCPPENIRKWLNMSFEYINYRYSISTHQFEERQLCNLQIFIGKAMNELKMVIKDSLNEIYKRLENNIDETFERIDYDASEYKAYCLELKELQGYKLEHEKLLRGYEERLRELEKRKDVYKTDLYSVRTNCEFYERLVEEDEDRIRKTEIKVSNFVNKYFNGIINEIAFNSNQIIFTLPDKEQLKDSIIANNLKLSNGNTYSGVKKDDIFCSNEGTIILYRTSISKHFKGYFNNDKGDIILIYNKKTYLLSDEVQRALIGKGYFNDNKRLNEEE